MSQFAAVPVLDVQKDNFKDLWPTLLLALKTATFVAIDTELSGLGDRRKLNSRCVDDRYRAISETAQTRSILSLGISCYKMKPTSTVTSSSQHLNVTDSGGGKLAVEQSNSDPTNDKLSAKSVKFTVQTFNVVLLCSEEYVVEPASLRFLVDHGFDFNRQYAHGISYYRGNDREIKEYQTIRQLFTEILVSKVPVVFHNAFVDLVFLYGSLFATLPSSLQSFLASLTEAFQGGIYDTKYITEFHARMTASFLEYVFRKSQRDDASRAATGQLHVDLSFLNYPLNYPHLNLLPCEPCQSSAKPHVVICQQFAGYGYCPHGKSCPLSHDVDLVLDNEHCTASKKRKRPRRKRKHGVTRTDHEVDQKEEKDLGNDDESEVVSELDTSLDEFHNGENLPTSRDSEVEPKEISQSNKYANEVSIDNITIKEKSSESVIIPDVDCNSTKKTEETLPSRTEGHRAGFDAFMTGYIFAHYLVRYGNIAAFQEGKGLSELGVSEFRNKVSLGGKDHPLHVTHSNFAKLAKDHAAKMEKIMMKSHEYE